MLASERAKLARAGFGPEGFPRRDDLDDDFSGLEGVAPLVTLDTPKASAGAAAGASRQRSVSSLDEALLRLAKGSSIGDETQAPREAGAPTEAVDDRSASVGRKGERGSRARMTVEAADDEDWPDTGTPPNRPRPPSRS
jgi:hypothetical protein